MQSLKPLDIPFGRKTKWLVTHVDSSSGHVYCQLSEPSISVKYERLYQDISACSEQNTLPINVLNPYIGELCLALYPEDNNWYRSQITEIDEPSKTAEVFFIDHGNTEIISFPSLRKLSSHFTELSPQAHECVLAHVEPVLKAERWSEKAIELIKELVLEQELTGVPIRIHRNLLVLNLFADSDCSVTVAEQLISAGFGQPKLSSSISGASSTSSLIRSTSIQSINSNSSKKSNTSKKSNVSNSSSQKVDLFKQFKLTKDQYIDFSVVFSEGINKFYCNPSNSRKDLDTLQSSLQTFYATNGTLCRKLAKNLPCCAKFSEDESWYRAVVQNPTNDNCTVFFADYGNVDTVPNNVIMEIDSQFVTLPSMAIECKLAGIKPLNGQTNYSADANAKFDELVLNKDSIVALISKVENTTAEVILYEQDEKSINQRLVSEGLVLAIKPFHEESLPKDLKSISSASSKKSVKNLKYVPASLAAGQEEKVYVSYSMTPHHFYVNLNSTSESLTQVMSEIASVYQSSSNLLKDPFVIGQPCIAKFSEDGEFYRAEIKEILKDAVKVQFIDYGNSEEAGGNELQVLRKEFIKLPKQGIRCMLSGVDAIQGTFTNEVCKKFEQIVMDKPLTMEIQEIVNGIAKVGLVVDDNSQVDVAKTLVLSGMVKEGKNPNKKSDYGNKVLTEEKYQGCNLNVECYIDVAPVHVETPSQFCCHVVQNAVEFKNMTDDLNQFYANVSVDSSIIWKKLMPCVALYSEDGCWYRAMIVSVQSKSIEITFIDFGNSTVVTSNDLRPIYSEFMKLPAQVFVCSLADIEPKERTWALEAISSFENMVLDKHLAAYVKSKNENNSYSVLLYDTKTSEKNVTQILIEQGFGKPLTGSNSFECDKYMSPKSKENVLVTAVNNYADFYVQLSKSVPQLDTLMGQLHEFYSQMNASDLQLISPIIGQYCCSCFTEDDGWYRACIEEVDGKQLTVRYIDYGNSEHLNIDRVKVLNPNFEMFPRFALPCCLENHKQLKSLDTASSVLLDKELDVQFKNKDAPFKIEVIDDGKPLSTKLLNSVKTIEPAKTESPKTEPPKTEPVKTNQQNGHAFAKCINPLVNNLKEGQSCSMYFIVATSPHEFFCQPTSTEQELLDLMENISSYVKTQKTEQFNGRVGDFALGMYKEDGSWYRIQVLEKSKQSYKVFFCDYGNNDVVSRDEILMLPSNLASLNQQAVVCSLFGVSPKTNEWCNGAVEMLNSICADQILDLKVVSKDSGKVNVDATNTNNQQNIAKMLIDANVAVSSTSSSSTKKTISYTKPEVATKETGYCTQVCSGTLVKVQLQKYESQLNELMEKLAIEAPQCQLLTSPNAGMPCLAIFADDSQWYRAEIVSCQDQNATVSFVDYGNTQVCPVASLKSLSSTMTELPRTCVDCVLHDVCETDIDVKKSEEHLSATLIDQVVSLEIKSPLNDESSLEAYVYQEGSEEHVNDLLYSLFALEEAEEAPKHVKESPEVVKEISEPANEKVQPSSAPSEKAISSPALSYNKPEVSSKETGYCTQVCSATLVKVQLQKYESQLNKLMEKLATEAPQCQSLTLPNAGMPCLAIFADDSQWYRAEIVSCQGQNATVSFVDYGNTQVCPVASLKSLSSTMAELPRTSVDCVLHDVCGTDIDVKKSEEHLSATLIDQVVSIEIKSPLNDESSLEAYVYQEGSEEHVNNLLYSLFALEEEQAPEPVKETPELTKEKVQPSSSSSEEVISSPALSYIKPEVASKETGYCTQVCSATLVKVQLQKYESQLNELMEKLAIEAPQCQLLTSPNAGMPCLAIFADDSQWYRAEIVSCQDQNATVSFVDYGNTQVCPVTSLKSLSSTMTELPRTSVDCVLHDVCETDIDVKKSEEHLSATLIDQVVSLEIKSPLNDESSLEAYVYQEGSEEHVNDLLYSLFALEEVEEAPEHVKETPEPVGEANVDEANVDERKPEKVKDILYPDVMPETSYSAVCYVIDSDLLLLCQLTQYQEQIDEMMVHISKNVEHYPLLEIKDGVDCVNSVCVAKYSVDSGWYRGRILKKDAAGVYINFVDFGNTEIIPASDVRVIPTECTTLPQTCISVKLHDVHLEDLDVDAAKVWLVQQLLEHVVRLEIKGKEDIVQVSAFVYSEGRDSHVNDQLYELFALPEGDVSTSTDPLVPTPKVEQESSSIKGKIKATCFIVDSAAVLKCQLTIFSARVDSLMNELGELGPSLPTQNVVTVGDFYAAQYSVDNEWYRVSVLEVTGETTVKVEFIDYGSVETIEVQNLKSLPDHLKATPQTCLTVNLHDVYPEDINSKAAKDYLEATFIEKEVVLDIVDDAAIPVISAYVYAKGNTNQHINDYIYEHFAIGDGSTEDSGISVGGASFVDFKKLEVGQHYNVKFIAVGENLTLYCQMLDLFDKLKQLSKEAEQNEGAFTRANKVETGSFYLMKSKADKKWKRIQVTHIGEDGMGHVFCFDDATQEVITLKDIFNLPKDLCSMLPRVTIVVKMHNVHISDIQEQQTKCWLSIMTGQEFKIDIVNYKESVAEAIVYLPNIPESINDQIYDKFSIGDATPCDQTISTLETTDQSNDQSNLYSEIKDSTQTSICGSEISGVEPLSSTIDTTVSSPLLSCFKTFPKAQLDQSEKVLCTYVASSSHASFQLLKYENVLNIITELLVDAPPEPFSEDLLRIGMAVIAQSVEDGNWYRGEIRSVLPDGYDILFIDFGNHETVPASHLREVFDVRFMQPATCITCKLENISDVDELKAKDWLEENCIDETFNAFFENLSGDHPSITIRFADKAGIDSVNEIVQSHFGYSPRVHNVSSNTQQKIEYKKDFNVETQMDAHKIKWIVPERGSYEKAICVSLTSYNHLNFHLVRLNPKLDKLMSDIANDVESLSGVRVLERHAPCIAQFSDLQWYRARILEPAEGYASVEFLDYGNTDDVIVEDIRTTRPDYLDEPVYCLKCRLHNVEIQNHESAEEYIKKTVIEDSPEVTIRIVDVDMKSLVVDIILIQEEHNINEFLRSSYGYVDNILRDCDIKLFDKVKITIPPTANLSLFWCILHESKGERDKMMQQMNSICPTLGLVPVTDLKKDMTCCALAGNGNWCRADIQNVTSDVVTVLMVDFGSVEEVKVCNVRLLPSEFLKLPIQGFKASIFNLRPLNDGWSKDAVDFFNKSCQEDVLTATVLNCTDQIRSLAIFKSNGDQMYELLSNGSFAVKSPQV